MNKEEILSKYKKQEDKLLIAKLFDKITIAEKQNKITYTNFLDLYQKKLLEKVLKEIHKENGIFFGGYRAAERTLLCFYPEKLEGISVEILSKEILEGVRINLPKESRRKIYP